MCYNLFINQWPSPLVGRLAADAQFVAGHCAFNARFATCFLWLYSSMKTPSRKGSTNIKSINPYRIPPAQDVAFVVMLRCRRGRNIGRLALSILRLLAGIIAKLAPPVVSLRDRLLAMSVCTFFIFCAHFILSPLCTFGLVCFSLACTVSAAANGNASRLVLPKIPRNTSAAVRSSWVLSLRSFAFCAMA